MSISKAPVNISNYYAEHKDTEKMLKPCPFCGNTEIELSLIHPQFFGKPDMDYWCYYEILCPVCGCNMQNGRLDPETWEEVKQDLIDNWNQRKGE